MASFIRLMIGAHRPAAKAHTADNINLNRLANWILSRRWGSAPIRRVGGEGWGRGGLL